MAQILVLIQLALSLLIQAENGTPEQRQLAISIATQTIQFTQNYVQELQVIPIEPPITTSEPITPIIANLTNPEPIQSIAPISNNPINNVIIPAESSIIEPPMPKPIESVEPKIKKYHKFEETISPKVLKHDDQSTVDVTIHLTDEDGEPMTDRLVEITQMIGNNREYIGGEADTTLLTSDSNGDVKITIKSRNEINNHLKVKIGTRASNGIGWGTVEEVRVIKIPTE